MASVGAAVERVKQQLQQRELLQEVEPICRELGYRWRRRVLDPLLTVQLLLLQALAHGSLVGLIQIAGLQVSPQALNQAFARLPLEVLLRLGERLVRRVALPLEPQRWHGLRIVIADAMSFLVQDTPQLLGKYRRHRGTQSYPCPKLLTLMDYATGLIRRTIILPYDRQELACFVRMFRWLTPGDVVLLDRAYGSFLHLQMLLAKQMHACIRLKRPLVSAPWSTCRYRRLRKLSRQDYLVIWHRPQQRPHWMSLRRWGQVPQQIVLRQISYRLLRKGYRTQHGWLITTLTDAQQYPASEILALYGQRWQIEVDFRDLKCTLGLRLCGGRTLAATRKQVLATVLVYNLIRLAMLEAARRQQTSPDRISFKATLLWMLFAAQPGALPPLPVNPRRRRHAQPRRLKNHRKRYNRLNQPRQALVRPPYQVTL